MSRSLVPPLLALALITSLAGAQTITVPGDYSTIQAAIDNVAPGGTIQVAPGTYVEELLVDPAGSYTCSAGQNPVALAIGELNGDDTPDVVYANITEDKVTISLAVPSALAQKFGMGCAGTGGLIPDISAVGLPTLGSPTFSVKVSNARPFAPALIGISLGLLDTTFGSGCHLYLEPEIITFQLFTNYLGEATLTFATPPAIPPFVGLDAYFQWAIFDPAGAHEGFLSFSDALRIKFGY